MPAQVEAAGPPPFFSRENLWYWVRLIAVVMTIKGCVVDQYRIPSESMEPTLHAGGFFGGDRILVNKWIMGPRIPFTSIRLWNWYEPQRWDIVVFHTVEAKSPEKILVKRIVGLPGDRIRIGEGTIFVNGEKIEKPKSVPDTTQYFGPEDFPRVKDPGAHAYLEAMQAQDPMRYGVGSKDDAFSVIPPGHYMMMGDNCMKSHDSRMYGWVPRDNIYGRVFGIWFPFGRLRDFTGFSHTWWGPFAIYIPLGALLLWILWDVLSDLRRVVRRRRKPEPPGDTEA